MTAITTRVTANGGVRVPGKNAISINLDTARGSVLISNNDGAAFQGHPLNINLGLAALSLEADGHVLAETTRVHLPLQGITVSASVLVGKEGPHGSFGFTLFDEAGASLYTYPYTQMDWGSVTI